MVFALVLLSKNTTNNTKKPPGLHNKKTKKQNLDNNTKPRPNSGGDSGTLIVAREIVEKSTLPPSQTSQQFPPGVIVSSVGVGLWGFVSKVKAKQY